MITAIIISNRWIKRCSGVSSRLKLKKIYSTAHPNVSVTCDPDLIQKPLDQHSQQKFFGLGARGFLLKVKTFLIKKHPVPYRLNERRNTYIIGIATAESMALQEEGNITQVIMSCGRECSNGSPLNIHGITRTHEINNQYSESGSD